MHSITYNCKLSYITKPYFSYNNYPKLTAPRSIVMQIPYRVLWYIAISAHMSKQLHICYLTSPTLDNTGHHKHKL